MWISVDETWAVVVTGSEIYQGAHSPYLTYLIYSTLCWIAGKTFTNFVQEFNTWDDIFATGYEFDIKFALFGLQCD